jgi:uncharacterized protein YutE (UPF0331/DUF86 family)
MSTSVFQEVLIDITERIKKNYTGTCDAKARFQVLSFESYLKDLTSRDAVKRNIEFAIQAFIDIARIIITRDGLRDPEDNKGLFIILAENGIISEDSLKFLIHMAGTRNVLVHGHDNKIDDAIVFSVLKKHLSDFYSFLKEIEERYFKK